MIMTFVTLLGLFFTYQLRHQISILSIGETFIYASFVETSIEGISNQTKGNFSGI
jgi:hypothetical protein